MKFFIFVRPMNSSNKINGVNSFAKISLSQQHHKSYKRSIPSIIYFLVLKVQVNETIIMTLMMISKWNTFTNHIDIHILISWKITATNIVFCYLIRIRLVHHQPIFINEHALDIYYGVTILTFADNFFSLCIAKLK